MKRNRRQNARPMRYGLGFALSSAPSFGIASASRQLHAGVFVFAVMLGFAFALSAMNLPSAFAADSASSDAGEGMGRVSVGYSIDEDGYGYATAEGVPFGLSGFTRMQTGANKTYNGVYEGYLYSLGKGAQKRIALTVLGTDEKIIVYVPKETAQAAGLDLDDPDAAAMLAAMLQTLDDRFANGGAQISKMGLPFQFTSEESFTEKGITYRFDFQLEQGRYYAGVLAEGAQTSRGITRFCDTCALLPADQVGMVVQGNWFQQVGAFLGKMDYRPLWVSLKTSLVAMVFIFLLGLLAAWRSMHVRSRWKSILDSLFTIPMVLPPTVCGFLLLMIFGKSTAFGQFLIDHGISLVFTWPAAVIAAVVVGFPLMYRTVLGAFEALDADMLNAARTLGWSEMSIFRKLMMPLAWPSIAAGTVLAFARAMGEFGCTLFFAGNFAGVTQTMPIAIYFSWMGGATDVAVFWVVVIILFSFLVILFINLWSNHTTKYNRREAIDE